MGILDIFKSKKIQATEGQGTTLDPLTPPVNSVSRTVRKNNFQGYDTQIDQIDVMYRAECDYGAELLRTIIDTRVAFICGEGLSINSENEKTSNFIKKIMTDNDLNSKFMDWVENTEKEGKELILITLDGLKNIKYKTVSYYEKKYIVKSNIYSEAESISIGDKVVFSDNEQFVYVWLYGTDINKPLPRSANILTQIENFSRALYDLREVNHLYGKPTPVFTCNTLDEARTIISKINAQKWKIGDAIVTVGDFKFVVPNREASESLKGEMALNIKVISALTGIPVHWLGWTDLMSNRSTAEEMGEMIEVATKKERLKWIEAIKELVIKSMVIAVDNGVEGAIYDPEGFEVAIPHISEQKLKEIIEVWLPLRDSGHISEQTFLNIVPNVNPMRERELIEQEKNNDLDNTMKKADEFMQIEDVQNE